MSRGLGGARNKGGKWGDTAYSLKTTSLCEVGNQECQQIPPKIPDSGLSADPTPKSTSKRTGGETRLKTLPKVECEKCQELINNIKWCNSHPTIDMLTHLGRVHRAVLEGTGGRRL